VSRSERLYYLAVGALRPLLPAAGLLPEKLAEAVRGRRLAAERARDWAAAERRPERPLLWLHGASAGELAGAAPVLRLLRDERPEVQLAVTCSSPSGLDAARTLDADYHGYVPLDARPECEEALDALRPDALVFAKLDLWPVLCRVAAERGVPLGLVNATVRPGSSRLRWPARSLMREIYAQLDAVGAVSERERASLRDLGVRDEAIRITGDAAFAQASSRVAAARARGEQRLPPRAAGAARLVAGSTWPADEEVLVEAAAGIGPALELVIVPHEPSEETMHRLVELCRDRLGMEPRIWSRLAAGDEPGRDPGPGRGAATAPTPILVDAVGILADLYLEADLALVGGAFDATGLHSVIEPAAAGLPVLFGPLHDRWEADDLLVRGAAMALERSTATAAIRGLVEGAGRRAEMGEAARRYVEEAPDATDAGCRLIAELLARGVSSRRGR
jgi:3-deoxy-D-manno-octulosonic-acid transferase